MDSKPGKDEKEGKKVLNPTSLKPDQQIKREKGVAQLHVALEDLDLHNLHITYIHEASHEASHT